MNRLFVLLSIVIICIVSVAFIYADSDDAISNKSSVAPSSDLITNKVIVPYPPPSTETLRPYPEPRKPTATPEPTIEITLPISATLQVASATSTSMPMILTMVAWYTTTPY